MLKNKIQEIKEYAGIHTAKETANYFAVSTTCIYNFLKKNNITYCKKQIAISDDVRDYCREHTLEEIYKHYDNMTYNYIRKYGIEFKRKLRKLQITDIGKKIVFAKSDGLKQSDIARKLNVTRQYVSLICKMYTVDNGKIIKRIENGK